MTDEQTWDGVAIIGMAGRFPGAPTADAFWANIKAGAESITFFSDAQLQAAGHDVARLRAEPGFVAARGILDRPEYFDAAFFGVTPLEAETTDPQQRLFLEVAWEALERAGYDPGRYAGPIGVYAGVGANTYYLHYLLARPDVLQMAGPMQELIGRDKDFIATRVAFKLNLKGPALNINTACSTSLVAVCQAVQALQTYQCDMALAGGVSIVLPQETGYVYEEEGIMSPDGHTRAFDAEAQGTVFSSGAGVVVLKRLADAVADGDHVYAVIKGAALNNDGSDKASFTAPSAKAHGEVIAMAHALAGVEPRTISYVETHGTATPIGDPIEIAGLTEAFRGGTSDTEFCAIGSLKTNVGHLDIAAGVAGLIKTAYALDECLLPPSLHYTRPNPRIDFASSPFFVNTTLRPWNAAHPRRAGVSSFGVGGTNAHVVLEEPPRGHVSGPSRDAQILVLSARTPTALDTATHRLAADLRARPDVNLADVAYTLQVGRKAFAHRRTIVCATAAEAVSVIDTDQRVRMPTDEAKGARRTVFMFPGGGAQYPGMALGLYEKEPAFRDALERVLGVAPDGLRPTLCGMLTGQRNDSREFEAPATALPALFAVEYALVALLRSWGLEPAALIGHSMGEYTAACVAGVLSLEDALRLVALRGTLFERLPAGGMLGTMLSEADAAPFLVNGISIAAVNRANQTVLSGPVAAIDAVEAQLSRQGEECSRIHIAVAAHSSMVEPILDEFSAFLRTIRWEAPRVPWVSNVSGTWITDAQAMSADYWVRHLRQTVQFASGLETLFARPDLVPVEVGPGQTLSTLARQHPARPARTPVISTVRHPKERADDQAFILSALGRAWSGGCEVDWPALWRGEHRRRVPLPTYPFERRRYCPDRPSAEPVRQPSAAPTPDVLLATRRATNGEEANHAAVAVAVADVVEGGMMTTANLGSDLPIDGSEGVSAVESVIRQQLDLMRQQLALLQGDTAGVVDGTAPEAPPVSGARVPGPDVPSRQTEGDQPAASLKLFAGVRAPATDDRWLPLDRGPDGQLTIAQRRHLDVLSQQYCARTSTSKALAERFRSRLVDPRNVASFGPAWKEMVYQIAARRSRGARLWDVDGNEYVDVTMGFGSALFGHGPSFIVRALEEQMALGIEVGLQSPLAGEVAELFCELTGAERVCFCTSGTDAVIGALRLARAATGRDRVATFIGDIHGRLDEVLGRPGVSDNRLISLPVAAGIPSHIVNPVLTLEYGTPAALDAIRANASELAAVLVEPVRTRQPALQPVDFLRALRALTKETGITLIMDEVVTGFRVGQRGAQGYFGIEGDLATWGKAAAGGLPIGVISGKAEFMDALDGGMWHFGDASGPEAPMTNYGGAGTFGKHPLTMAAAKACLTHMKESGPRLQEDLNARTAAFAAALNDHFRAEDLPLHVEQFSSFFLPRILGDRRFEAVLFHHLRLRGVHIYLDYPCFLSTAHTDADIAPVIDAFRESAAAMRADGLLSRRSAAPSSPRLA